MTSFLSAYIKMMKRGRKQYIFCRSVFVAIKEKLCYYFLAEGVSAGGIKVKEAHFKRLIFLNPSEIIPPSSVRREYDRYRLFLLSESIRENGLLVPVAVRQTQEGYEVISGEKRIKASIIAGLKKIPCIVTDFFDAELYRATEENAGQEFSLIEEADRLYELCKKHSLSTVAKTLSFTTGELEKIVKVAKLPKEIRDKAVNQKLSVNNISALFEESREDKTVYLPKKEKKSVKDGEKKLPPIKDTRFFLNSVKQLTESVRDAGIPVNYKQKDTENSLEIRIKIDKSSVFSQMSLL